MSNFVNLHGHTVYSIRDSIAKIPDLVSKAKELGHPAMAITDHGIAAGTLKFYHKCKEEGIKPLIGSELYITNRSRFQKEQGVDRTYHLTVIAQNAVGWRNLSRLISESFHRDHFWYKPRIDRELLEKHSEGLIVLSGCIGGNLINSIGKKLNLNMDFDEDYDSEADVSCSQNQSDEPSHLANNEETPEDVIEWYRRVFGDRYYLEVQNHYTRNDAAFNDYIYSLSQKYGIKVVATGDTHVVNETDIVAHNAMIATRDKTTIHDPKLKRYPGNGYHLMSDREMNERFPGNSEFVTNTLEIADRCNFDFELNNYQLPHLVDPDKEDEVFEQRVLEGLSWRFKGETIPDNYLARIAEEIELIIQMTFPSYFLMTADYVQWAKKNGIPVGPGRGSAGGSLVAYALQITEIDPIKYNLSFARFLNPGRSSKPIINLKPKCTCNNH